MEEALDIPPMDLKASAEQEVRKLQDMVKRLEKQNEILRNSQNVGQEDISVPRKRDSVTLEEVTLINLNDSSDDLEDSWLYESPVKAATPAQKSINSMKWAKTITVGGLDDVRGNLIDKLDDIDMHQEISKVKIMQNSENKISLTNAPKNPMFFQPTSKTSKRNEVNNSQLDSSSCGSMDDEMEDVPQGPILRRSALGKDSSPISSTQQITSENVDDEPQGPILRRSALGKNSPKSDFSSVHDEMDDEIQGPIVRRSAAVSKGSSKVELPSTSQSDISDDVPQGPILRRSALPKDAKPSQLNGSPEKLAMKTSPRSRVQPRSRRTQLTDNVAEGGNQDIGSQTSQDDLDEDKGPVVKRSALALPKPSSEGLSKQLWYSGPISQMNKQKSTAVQRSVSPSPDRRNKLQPRSPATAAGGTRRSTGTRGSADNLLDIDDSLPVQRRSLPQVPMEAASGRSRATRSDERMQTPTKAKSKIQNLQQPQGNVVARRSKLAAPSSNSPNRDVVARRRAPAQNANNLDDSWKEGCY